jgi:hypothetical protein
MLNSANAEVRKDQHLPLGKTKSAIKTTYPDATVYKPLTGEVYYFPGVSLEIIYTFLDYLPGNVINFPGTDGYPLNGDANMLTNGGPP